MEINKKISALLCSIAMYCSSGQVSKTSASFLGYFFSVAAVQGWVETVSYYYSVFRSEFPIYKNYYCVNLFRPNTNKIPAGKGFKQVAESLSRLANLKFPVVLTYLAREEFRKEKENNEKVRNENMYVDPKNSKDKRSDTNK